MSELSTNPNSPLQTSKKAPLWPMALVILAIVFIPTLLAWMLTLIAG